MKVCFHEKFVSQVRVTRLTEGDSREVTGYSADINITCAECGLPFRFIGLKGGVSSGHPTGSANGLELRAPIAPAAPRGKACS